MRRRAQIHFLRIAIPLMAALTLSSCGTEPNSYILDTTSDSDFNVNIGSFNILRLGHGDKKNYSRLADIILDAEFDILSVQEVMKPEGATTLLEDLNTVSHDSWDMIMTQSPTGEGNYKENYAVFYKSEYIEPIKRVGNYCGSRKAEDFSEYKYGCYAKDNYDSGEADFSRDPYVTMFSYLDNEIALVSNHLHYGNDSRSEIEKRQKEIQNLKQVMRDVRQKSPDAKVVTLGDFNLELDAYMGQSEYHQGPQVPESFLEYDEKIIALIDEPTTIGNSNYDHFFFFDDQKRQACAPLENSAKVFIRSSLRTQAAKDEYKETISDHFPIGVTLNCGITD